jgi:hypothetical protein
MAQETQHRKAKVSRNAVAQPRKKRGAKGTDAIKARRQVKEIINALKEAEQIHKGKRKGKGFDEFLEEL